MKIAIPTAEGLLCPHFGHCQEFTFLDVDTAEKKILNIESKVPPPHEPGVLPKWLEQHDCNLVIVGGMGQRAISLLENAGVVVVSGAPSKRPEDIVRDYLDGQLMVGGNLCSEPGFHAGGHTDCGNRHSH